MSGDRVFYNGVEMAAEWPARIEAAQKIREYTIGGVAHARIPYGKEEGGGDFVEPCHDCRVLPGPVSRRVYMRYGGGSPVS